MLDANTSTIRSARTGAGKVLVEHGPKFFLAFFNHLSIISSSSANLLRFRRPSRFISRNLSSLQTAVVDYPKVKTKQYKKSEGDESILYYIITKRSALIELT